MAPFADIDDGIGIGHCQCQGRTSMSSVLLYHIVQKPESGQTKAVNSLIRLDFLIRARFLVFDHPLPSKHMVL